MVARQYAYTATLVPALWQLGLSHRSRVFQDMTVQGIVSTVLQEDGLSATDFAFDLETSLPTREYCVQYRESDLSFIMRLLEQEGIYFFFEQTGSKEKVVFTDQRASSPAIEGDATVAYHSGAGLVPPAESVREFTTEHQLVTGTVILKDYNYRTPETQLRSTSQINSEMPGVYYEYGDHFKDEGDGDRLARIRNQEIEARRHVFNAESDCPAMRAGHTFSLGQHFRPDLNSEYLLVRVEHEINQGSGVGLSPESEGPGYVNRFTCIPAATPFRPARTTPVPRLPGVMTARVETGGGDYAYIDDQGRYRVKMPFDLGDRTNGIASRAIRMAQPYSGANYGIHFPNKAGSEMVWACVDGNVDRPLGLATIPNPSNVSPSVSGNNAQNVIRTAGLNELTMDDTIGAENIYLHGTKDWTIDITNDKNQKVGNNETLDVVANRDKTVGGNQSETIAQNKVIEVGGTHTERITGHMSQLVSSTKSETIALAKSLEIGAAYQVGVGAAMNELIGGLKNEGIGGAKIVKVGAFSSEDVGLNKSVDAGKDISHEAGSNITERAGKDFGCRAGQDFTVQAGKKVIVVAGDDLGIRGKKNGVIELANSLTIKCGKAVIKLNKNGDIVINGKNINTRGSGKIVSKGKKILQN
jgi:type VI secretion system secreted protein VgrG